MDPISNQVYSHDSEKWMLEPKNTQVNAPAPFDLDPSKGTRKAKESDKKEKKKDERERDPRFPQLRRGKES